MMKSDKVVPFTALMITRDLLLYERFSSLVNDRFRGQLNRFNEEEVRNSLLFKKPLFLIWDGRRPSNRWPTMISWLRDYYHGIPIIALIDESDTALNQQLSRMGVNQTVNCPDECMDENLQLHIFAILLDREQNRESLMPQNTQ